MLIINNLQEHILSVLFHDLRGVLGTIDNFTSILCQDYDSFSDEDKKRFLKTLSITASQLNSSVDSLLSWSYFKIDKLDLDFEMVDLTNIINIIINQFSNYSGIKNIKINFNFNRAVIINIIEGLITIALQNIIHNAIKYSNYNGEIDIDVFKKRNKYHISIKDYGTGIKKVNQNKLFQIPCQFRTSGTNGESGFGMGLVIAKDFIEACSGSISLESAWKKGTEVEIILNP